MVAQALGLDPKAYDLRCNQAGIAVSGEITLHSESLYVQVSQPFGGFDSGVLIRSCAGRRDYVGGPNTMVSLDLLHQPAVLAQRIRDLGQARNKWIGHGEASTPLRHGSAI